MTYTQSDKKKIGAPEENRIQQAEAELRTQIRDTVPLPWLRSKNSNPKSELRTLTQNSDQDLEHITKTHIQRQNSYIRVFDMWDRALTGL